MNENKLKTILALTAIIVISVLGVLFYTNTLSQWNMTIAICFTLFLLAFGFIVVGKMKPKKLATVLASSIFIVAFLVSAFPAQAQGGADNNLYERGNVQVYASPFTPVPRHQYMNSQFCILYKGDAAECYKQTIDNQYRNFGYLIQGSSLEAGATALLYKSASGTVVSGIVILEYGITANHVASIIDQNTDSGNPNRGLCMLYENHDGHSTVSAYNWVTGRWDIVLDSFWMGIGMPNGSEQQLYSLTAQWGRDIGRCYGFARWATYYGVWR